jgi:hypothetical protein
MLNVVFPLDDPSRPDGREVPAVSSVERISVEAAQDILAENYAAYAAKWGKPA